jgi:HAE1 family hydrophobic/amphiphilic exporter-1
VEAASPVPQSGGAPSGQTSLGAVASFTEAPGFGSIHRHDRESIVQLLATLEEEGIEQVRDRVSARLADLPLPRGYRIGFGDRFKELEEMKSDELFAAVLAIAFVFLLMGILFESWLLPLAVLASLPFAFVGATWALALTGTTRDVMAMVGMVILIGVVVNNAIVLVDAINRLRREGLARADAIVRAGRERLRPILMTALTTIGGLLPLALGTAQVAGVSYAPLARPVIGGLLTSTLVTLVLVPTAYALLDDLGGALRQIARAGVVGSRRPRE